MEIAPRHRLARAGGALLLAVGLSTPLAAAADDHDPSESGHPLEVIGTILYPVGWLVDTVLLRPLHWLANHEPLSTVTGHQAGPEQDLTEDPAHEAAHEAAHDPAHGAAQEEAHEADDEAVE